MNHRYSYRSSKRVYPVSDYKQALALFDEVYSRVIRKRDIERFRGICPICRIRHIEVAFHFIPRFKLATRFELDNGCGTCAICNGEEQRMRGLINRYRKFHISLVGEERVEQLELLSRQVFKKSAAEINEMAAVMKAKYLQH